MTENEIKALVVGPEDTLFVVFKDANVSRHMLESMRKSMFETRPELKGRVFIMSGEDMELAIVKKTEVKNAKSNA